jgi:hypothetical protein
MLPAAIVHGGIAKHSLPRSLGVRIGVIAVIVQTLTSVCQPKILGDCRWEIRGQPQRGKNLSRSAARFLFETPRECAVKVFHGITHAIAAGRTIRLN